MLWEKRILRVTFKSRPKLLLAPTTIVGAARAPHTRTALVVLARRCGTGGYGEPAGREQDPIEAAPETPRGLETHRFGKPYEAVWKYSDFRFPDVWIYPYIPNNTYGWI